MSVSCENAAVPRIAVGVISRQDVRERTTCIAVSAYSGISTRVM